MNTRRILPILLAAVGGTACAGTPPFPPVTTVPPAMRARYDFMIEVAGPQGIAAGFCNQNTTCALGFTAPNGELAKLSVSGHTLTYTSRSCSQVAQVAGSEQENYELCGVHVRVEPLK